MHLGPFLMSKCKFMPKNLHKSNFFYKFATKLKLTTLLIKQIMKKISMYLSAALVAFAATLVSCSDIDNPATSGVSSEADFITAVQAGGTVVLGKNANITLTEGITAGPNLKLIGYPDAPAKITFGEQGITTSSSIILSHVDIDATALTKPLIQLDNVTLAEGQKAVTIDNISFNDVEVLGLPYQLIYANKQKYIVKSLSVENSILGVDGTKKKTIFDFNGGGLPEALTINNSTIYSIPTCNSNGGFFSTQSGSKIDDLGAEGFVLSITNSTLYNITNARTVNSLRQNSQDTQKFIVKNSIIVDCGKNGQFLKGLNAGSPGKDANWEVKENVFNFGGAVSAEQKIGSTEENIVGSIDVIVTFNDVENGDFTQYSANAGDPRWLPQE